MAIAEVIGDFRVADTALQMSCDSVAVVNVAGRLDVEASQNSIVYYLGQPASGEIMAHENASVEPK